MNRARLAHLTADITSDAKQRIDFGFQIVIFFNGRTAHPMAHAALNAGLCIHLIWLIELNSCPDYARRISNNHGWFVNSHFFLEQSDSFIPDKLRCNCLQFLGVSEWKYSCAKNSSH